MSFAVVRLFSVTAVTTMRVPAAQPPARPPPLPIGRSDPPVFPKAKVAQEMRVHVPEGPYDDRRLQVVRKKRRH
jgi:hypothetical protein